MARIIAVRKEHPTWGPKKIRAWLQDHHFWRVPAASSIGAVLKQYGLVSDARRSPRRPRPGAPTEPTSHPNDTWCVDFKGHFLTKSAGRCYPLTLTDHQTRYLLKCEALGQADEAHVRPHFELAFHEFGLPDRIRSDNGPPFATNTIGKLSKLSIWWIKLGIRPERIEPGHPEQNGRHERMHRTLGDEVSRQTDLSEQQLAYDRFRSVYNEQRPHEALGQKPPAKFYRPSRRLIPALIKDPEYPSTMVVRRIDHSGRMRFRGSTHVTVSQTLAGELVALEPYDQDQWILYFGSAALALVEAKDKEIVFSPVPETVPLFVEHTLAR